MIYQWRLVVVFLTGNHASASQLCWSPLKEPTRMSTQCSLTVEKKLLSVTQKETQNAAANVALPFRRCLKSPSWASWSGLLFSFPSSQRRCRWKGTSARSGSTPKAVRKNRHRRPDRHTAGTLSVSFPDSSHVVPEPSTRCQCLPQPRDSALHEGRPGCTTRAWLCDHSSSLLKVFGRCQTVCGLKLREVREVKHRQQRNCWEGKR